MTNQSFWRKFCLYLLGGLLVVAGVNSRAQAVVVTAGTTNLFTGAIAATNFAWTLDGVTVGGSSNSYAYQPQTYDVGTHYLIANETFPGGSTSNAYWEVRVRIVLPTAATNFYVSTNGADTNPGTLAAPFLTLEKAVSAVRGLTRPLPSGGVTVWLRGGTYYRTNTLMLTNVNDSGSVTAPVVYSSYPGETAVISGGKPISAASFVPLNSSQTNRVAPGVNPASILELDLTNAGIVHAQTFPADFNQWDVYNTYNSSVSSGLCELMYNDQRQFLSRYPHHNLTNDDLLTTNLVMNGVAQGLVKPGTTLIYAGDNTNSLNYPGTYTNSSGVPISVGGAFYVSSNLVSSFQRWSSAITNGGMWLQGYWRVAWQIDGVQVIGFDATNRAVLLSPSSQPGNGIGNKYNRPGGSHAEPFWVMNLLETMDQPGEWCVDFNRRKIYFYAPAPLTNGSVTISDLGSPLIQVAGGSNLVFQALVLEDGLAQGIFITNGMRNLVLGCDLHNMGNFPVDINGGGTNGVVSCNLHDLAAGGVLLRGGTENTNASLRVAAHDYVVNDVITNFARVVRVYAAAVDAGYGGAGGAGGGGGHTTCVGMRVAHNNISYAPHGAVLIGSWDTIHEYNDISHYQQVSDDLGAFYSYDYIYQHGNHTFRYNFLHDTPLGNGIDFDQDHYQMNIYGNVMNLNTIPSESQGVGIRYQNAQQATAGYQQAENCYNNLVANGHLGCSFVAPIPSVIQSNVAVACTTGFTWSQVVVGTSSNTFVGSTAAAMQSGTNVAFATDPGFLGLSSNDLRLTPNSLVYSNVPGFQPIPFELIGLYNDEYRTNVPGYSPYVTTTNASSLTSSNAMCRGWLYFPQFDSNTTVTAYYGTTDGGSNALAWQAATNLGVWGAGPVSASVQGLQGGTNYYFRFFAANAYGSAWSPKSVSLVTPPALPLPYFTNLTASQVILASNTAVLGGQVMASGPLYPALGETVSITINGQTVNTTISDNTGDFTVAFGTTNVPTSPLPYVIAYAYAGNTNLAATNNFNTLLTVVPATYLWTGVAGTNFEAGGTNGTGGNWGGYPAPINDPVACTALFSNPVTGNLPSLTQSRLVRGLAFAAPAGGWKLGSGSTNYFLTVGAGGISTAGQSSGTNVISANLAPAAAQTWLAGTGGNLIISGAITNAQSPQTNYSLTFNASGNLGDIVLSPAAGAGLNLVGSNTSASIWQVKSGGLLELGGDGVNVAATTSTNSIVNSSSNSYAALALNTPGKVKVNSGYWIFSDLGKNGGDRFTGTLEVDGGTLSLGGARYLGEGTIQVNGGVLRCTVDLNTHYINGGRFSPGSVYTSTNGIAVMNVTGGLVDLAPADGSVYGANCIGSGLSTLLNQSGGTLQNSVTANGHSFTTFTIGGVAGASGVGNTNNLTAYTLAGGTFLSSGTVAGAGVPGPGSVNNFNFVGGVLAVAGINVTNLGSSPNATAYANQTNVSVAVGTLANYGGTLAPGGLGIPGKTLVSGNYAVSNNAAVLAIDLGGTNQANTFQNGGTNYDFVSVAGSTVLGGSLAVNLVNGFLPSATQSFVILTNGGTISGSFTNLVGSDVAVTNLAGASMQVVITGSSVVLTNFQMLQASGTPSSTGGAAPLTVTFTDTSTGSITNRFWNFGDGSSTNTLATGVTHTYVGVGTNVVTLAVSGVAGTSSTQMNIVVTGPPSSVPPVLGAIAVAGTNLLLTGSNGVGGNSYLVLATTNLNVPLSNWTVLATNQFGAGGVFAYTNSAGVSGGQMFFRVRLP